MKWTLRLLTLPLIFALSACGGGSGSSDPDPDPQVVVPTIEVTPLSDKSVSEGETVTFTVAVTQGSVSDLDFEWTVSGMEGIVFEGQGTNTISITAPAVTMDRILFVTVDLSLKNGTLLGDSELSSSLYVLNAEPVAVAGLNKQVKQASAVTLDATSSYDDKNNIVSYQWTQVSGAPVTLSNAETAVASFTAPETGTSPEQLEFQVKVEDGQGFVDFDSVIIEVQANQAPNAVISADTEVDENSVFELDASLSTDDLQVTSVQWTQLSGPNITFDDSTANMTSFTAPLVDEETTLTVQLTVFDNQGMSTTATTDITVKPTDLPPVLTNLDISSSNERSTISITVDAHDPDGEIVSWAWRQVEGPIVEVTGNGTNSISFYAPDVSNGLEGVKFSLTVTDNDGQFAFTHSISAFIGTPLVSNQFLYPLNNGIIADNSTSLSGYISEAFTLQNTLLGEVGDYSGLQVTVSSGEHSETVTTDSEGFWHISSFALSSENGIATITSSVTLENGTTLEETINLTISAETSADNIAHSGQYASLLAGAEGINLYFTDPANNHQLKRLSMADNVVTNMVDDLFTEAYNGNIVGYFSDAPSYERLDKLVSLQSDKLSLIDLNASATREFASVTVEADVFESVYNGQLFALSPTKLFVQDKSLITGGSQSTATALVLPTEHGNFQALDVMGSGNETEVWALTDGFDGLLQLSASTGAVSKQIDLTEQLTNGDALTDIVLGGSSAYVIVAGKGIAQVNLETETFSWLSDADNGVGPALTNPTEMKLSANKKVLYVVDSGSKVFVVELATGNRVIVGS